MSAEVENTETPVEEVEEKTPPTPEWVDKELKTVRGEAAASRVKLREAEARLAEKEATLQDLTAKVSEAAKVETELHGVQRQISQIRAALAAGVPATDAKSFVTLAGRLQGDSEEDMIEDAKTILELIGQAKPGPKPDPSQGHGNPNAIGSTAFEAMLRQKLDIR